MSGFSRELPRKVQQYKEDGKVTCWAAALESWMSVTPQSPASWFMKTQDDALSSWKSFTVDGGLEVKWGFRLMAAGVGMEYQVCKPAKKITGALIYSKLKQKSHIYLLFAGGMTMTSGQIGHCVVIYGVENPWSNDCKVSYMDPWFGDYKKDEPLSYFQNANEAVVGWFEYAS